MTFRTCFTAITVASGLALAAPASASTLNIIGSFSGGQLGDVSFDVLIDNDFSAATTDNTSDLTINSFTSSILGDNPFELGFNFTPNADLLTLGGVENTVASINIFSDDFVLSATDVFGDNPQVAPILDSAAGTFLFSFATLGEFSANAPVEVAPVPLPASAVLLLAGLAGLAGFGRRAKKHAA